MNKKVEVGLEVGVIILLMILVVAFMLRGRTTPGTVNPGSSPSTTTTTTTPSTTTETPAETPPASVASPVTTTMIFVERFNSYSSESDFANVTDVLPLVTTSLAAKIQGIAQDQRTTDTTAYYGISTKVISQKIQEQTDTTATILVSTQRQESIGSPGNTTVRYQDITVKLVKEGDTWKVNDFSWAN